MSGISALQACGITKRFPGVTALSEVDISIEEGEVHALIGENGAGKSTLTRIVAGDYPPDEGKLLLAGTEVRLTSPREARARGVRLVTQERALVPALSVAENLMIGRIPRLTRLGPIDRHALRREATRALDRVGLDLDPSIEVVRLRPAEQQLVEIAKALAHEGRLLILDEPTAALSNEEAERLFAAVRAQRDRGVGVIYISHRVGELQAIADTVTVLRDGRVVGRHVLAETTEETLIREMIGRELGDLYPRHRTCPGRVVLKFENVSARGICERVSLQVAEGEIVAIFGLVGSGAVELPYLAAGRIPVQAGHVWTGATPGLVPVDRRAEGLLPQASVYRNIGVASLRRYSRAGAYRRGLERAAARAQIEQVGLRPARTEARISELSGGNQQKAIVARWLEADAQLLLLSEPTRGVDIGARADVYRILADRCFRGTAVMIASSDLDEVVGLADRVYVMSRGRVVTELEGSAITPEAVFGAATR